MFTHAYNDWESLKFWEHHYAKFVSQRHLYVIDHGSDRRPPDALHRDTQIVSIPRGAVDHFNISQFCGYFQRFLLSQYRWVIQTVPADGSGDDFPGTVAIAGVRLWLNGPRTPSRS